MRDKEKTDRKTSACPADPEKKNNLLYYNIFTAKNQVNSVYLVLAFLREVCYNHKLCNKYSFSFWSVKKCLKLQQKKA